MNNPSVKYYYSNIHREAAELFSKLAKDQEDKHKETEAKRGKEIMPTKIYTLHKIYVVNSILSSTAFLEATINEFYQEIYDGNNAYTKKLKPAHICKLNCFWEINELKNKSTKILEKYQEALEICEKKIFDKGKKHYSNVKTSIRLRNELTHFKPEFNDAKKPHKILKHFNMKHLRNPLFGNSDDIYTLNKILSHNTADWMIKAYKDFIDAFFKKFDLKPNYKRIKTTIF